MFFPIAGEPCVGVGKVSEEQVLSVRGPPWSFESCLPPKRAAGVASHGCGGGGCWGRSDSSS